MLTAITRGPSGRLADCELSFVERQAIDVERARAQHREYQAALRAAGVRVIELPALDQLPDSSFVEDTAVVLDELAIMAPLGSAARVAESAFMADELARYRSIQRLESPATLEGGDVVQFDRTLYVGQTARTNGAAVEQLRSVLAKHGYRVTAVPVSGCLHLKTACSRLDDMTVLVNPECLDAAVFDGVSIVPVPADEAAGANVLHAGETVIVPASAPVTRAFLEGRGFRTLAVDISEFEKAEAGLTCLSLVFQAT